MKRWITPQEAAPILGVLPTSVWGSLQFAQKQVRRKKATGANMCLYHHADVVRFAEARQRGSELAALEAALAEERRPLAAQLEVIDARIRDLRRERRALGLPRVIERKKPPAPPQPEPDFFTFDCAPLDVAKLS